MIKIIRSLAWKDPAEKVEATQNYGLIRKERFLTLKQAEGKIIDEMINFFSTFGEAPSYQVIHDMITNQSLSEELVILEEAGAEPFYTGAALDQTIEDEVEVQAARDLREKCSQALKIANQGITIKGTIIKGTREAVSYLVSAAQPAPPKGTQISSSLKEAAPKLIQMLADRKKNPTTAYGIPTGYNIIDTATGGIRKGNFYVHAGFAAHLKTTQMLNMIVNQAVAGWNPYLFSSEMPANEVKLLLAAIHSADKKFGGVGKPIPAFKMLLGALTAAEDAFLKDVLDDLVNNSAHGLIRVIDSGEFLGFGSIVQRTTRDHMDHEVDMLWIDYLTRLPPDPHYRGMSITEARNETIAEAKRFSLSFNQGRGIAVGTPFQVNREGFKRAMENEGKMDHSALAQYNSIEREADIISYVWYAEEERLTCEPKCGMIKARWGGIPSTPVRLFIEPDSRRMFDLGAGGMVTTGAPTQAAGSAEDEVML